MIQTSWKDIVIGVLVGYVVLDLMDKYPSVLEQAIGTRNGNITIVTILIAIAIGLLVWYLSSRSKTEYFKRQVVDKDIKISDEN